MVQMSSSATPITSAVVGCGAISFEHLAYLADSNLTTLVATCDSSSASADFAKSQYRAGQSFTDFNTMMASCHPTVVHVLTPPHTHRALIEQCLNAGSHVVCEKPMTATFAETDALLTMAANSNRVLIESRNLLYNDPIIAIDQLVAAGKLGDVREVEILLSLDLVSGRFGDLNLHGAGVQLPGGAVHDFLPHLAYLLLHFFGDIDHVDRVKGSLTNASGNSRIGFDQLDALVTAGKLRGRLRLASDLKPDTFRVAVRGTLASVETDLYNPFLRLEGGINTGKRAPIEQFISGVKLSAAGAMNFKNKVLQHGGYHGMPRMLDAVYQSIATGSAPPITQRNIRATALLVDQLVQLGQEHS